MLNDRKSLSAIDKIFSQIDHLDDASHKHPHYHDLVLRNKASFTSLCSNDDFIRRYFEHDDIRCKISYKTIIKHILQKFKIWVFELVGIQRDTSTPFMAMAAYERDIFSKDYSDYEYDEEYDLDNVWL